MIDARNAGDDPLTPGKILGVLSVGLGIAVGWSVVFVCATEIYARSLFSR